MDNKSLFSNKVCRIIVVVILMFPLLANSSIKPNLAGPIKIYVDTRVIGGLNNGKSWPNAFVYLQDALDITRANGTTDYEIWVADGVYYPDEDSDGDHTDNDEGESFLIDYDNVIMYGGFSGGETLLAQRDWETNLTILSGDIDGNDENTDGNFIAEDWNDISGTNSERVVLLNGKTNEDLTLNTVIDGFVITGGDATGMFGGGLLCYAGGLIPAGVCSPVLRNLRVQGNLASHGGGIALNVSQDGVSNPHITNVTFVGNSSVNDGGGMAFIASHHVDGEINPVLVNISFRENYAGGSGGGLLIYAYLGTSNPHLTNVEFYDNECVQDGGGIYTHANDGIVNPVLTNVTFHNNSADEGGAIKNVRSGTGVFGMEINNSILWGDNSSPPESEISNLSATPTIADSDVEGCGGSSGWDSSCGLDGGGNIDSNPLFVNPVAGDLTLQDGSPAVDAGDQILLPADITDQDQDGDTGETIENDLVMNPRVAFSNVDMGAFENGIFVDNVGFYVPSQGKWYLKYNQTSGWTEFVAFKFGGPSGSLAVSGDWDNDGVDTVGFYVPSQGKWYLKNNQTDGWTDFVAFNFAGPTGSLAVAGDWDNDGVDTVGFYVPSQGKWYLKNNQINGWNDYLAFNFAGPTGSQPVAGDWDNDGIDTVGFYVPSQGKWYLKNNQINGWNDFVAINFAGVTGSLAVAGDWDGDGEGTIGFYVPSQMKWYLKNNQINGWNDYVAFNFGGPTGSQPVAGDWE